MKNRIHNGRMEISLEELLQNLDKIGSTGSPLGPVGRSAAYLIRTHIQESHEIEQICGKALEYPAYKDDQKNFPGTSEKDGVCVEEHTAESIVSELANAYVRVYGLKRTDNITRLHESESFSWDGIKE